jgi:hypothetical protein
MKRFFPGWFSLIIAVLIAPPLVRAQAAAGRGGPHLGFVYPAGGQRGTTVSVIVGGQALIGATNGYFSGAGITATVTDYERPLTQKEMNDLREQADKLQAKRAAKTALTEEELKLAAEIRAKLANRPNRQASPALAETVTLEVTIADIAVVGAHELRLKTATGLSNPIAFVVGELPEFREPAVNATSRPAPSFNRGGGAPTTATSHPPLAVTLPGTVNGQLLPGEVDAFRFAARAGQTIVARTEARSLMPYLADAVPGWFQATLTLRDAQGREVAFADDYRFDPDPVLCARIRTDGDYTLEIRDAVSRGREDFVYRIAVGELPFIASVFPLGAGAGAAAHFEVAGWNLARHAAQLDTADRNPGVIRLAVHEGDLASNAVPVALSAGTEILEAEPNNDGAHAVLCSYPVIVNGRIDRAGDVDLFAFTGHAGAAFVIEVTARRLGSPLDSMITLTDAAGVVIAHNDDFEDKGAGLLTHQADSRVAVTLPADGKYFCELRDAAGHGGAEYSYRLRLGPPQPDFELRLVPGSLTVRAGMTIAATAYVLRRDEFDGPVDLALVDAPRGFAISGARIPAHADHVQFTLTAPPQPADDPYVLQLAGTARIGDATVTRRAVPAEDMMQAFSYRHLVPVQQWWVNVAGRGGSFRVLSRLPLQIPAGGTARLRVAMPTGRFARDVEFKLEGGPDGLTLDQSVTNDVAEVVIRCDASKLRPATRGNLILNASAARPGAAAPAKAGAGRLPLGTLPAIPFEIVVPTTPTA